MVERLVADNAINLKRIEEEYKKRIIDSKKKAISETKEFVELIHYNRTHSYDEICKDIQSKAKKMYVDIDDYAALRSGLFQNIERNYEKNYDITRLTKQEIRSIVSGEIDKIIPTLNEDEKKKIIENYKRKNYNRYVHIESNKAFESHDLFNSISEEELKDFVSLFYDYRERDAFYEARVEAITKVCEDLKAGLPLCLDGEYEIKAVDNKIASITNIKDENEETKSFASRVKDSAKKGINAILDNPNTSLKISALSFVVGGIAYMLTYSSTLNLDYSVASWVFGTPVVAAGLATCYNIAAKHDDKIAIEESKKLGLFERKVKLKEKENAFLDYTNMLKDKYCTLEIEEGPDGLHK